MVVVVVVVVSAVVGVCGVVNSYSNCRSSVVVLVAVLFIDH